MPAAGRQQARRAELSLPGQVPTSIRWNGGTVAPILKAIVASGDVYEDPSEDVLFILLSDLEEGVEEFVIVEKTQDASGQTYAQVCLDPERRYQVEHRDGVPERHFQAFASDKRVAHDVLTRWAFDLPGWREAVAWMPWSPD
jgi:hypothetical protein